MESNRPDEWESMGKPKIFSGKYTEKNARFMEFVEDESDSQDIEMTLLWEKTTRLRQSLVTVTWSAFGMYLFTIFAVRFLLAQTSVL